jgi:hypothetical protein
MKSNRKRQIYLLYVNLMHSLKKNLCFSLLKCSFLYNEQFVSSPSLCFVVNKRIHCYVVTLVQNVTCCYGQVFSPNSQYSPWLFPWPMTSKLVQKNIKIYRCNIDEKIHFYRKFFNFCCSTLAPLGNVLTK